MTAREVDGVNFEALIQFLEDNLERDEVFWLMLVTVTAHAGWRRYRLRRASRREDG